MRLVGWFEGASPCFGCGAVLGIGTLATATGALLAAAGSVGASALAAGGTTVVARGIGFPDHHAYQRPELKLPGAELVVMTEKDAVKCAAFADSRMWFLRVEAILPREFDEFLLAKLTQLRRSADGSQAA